MTTTTTYLVPGMSCDHCIRAVTEELLRVDGVAAVHIDLASKQVDVDIRSGSVDDAALRAAIETAGYEAA